MRVLRSRAVEVTAEEHARGSERRASQGVNQRYLHLIVGGNCSEHVEHDTLFGATPIAQDTNGDRDGLQGAVEVELAFERSHAVEE